MVCGERATLARLDEADQRSPRQPNHRPDRARHRTLEAVDDLRLDRSRTERRHRRRRQRRRNAGASRAARRRRRIWRRPRPGSSHPIRRRAACGARTTAGRRGTSSPTRATGGCITARSESIRRIRRLRTRAVRRSSRRWTAARRGTPCREFRTAIITPSGSIRRTANTCCSAMTAVSTSATTGATRGSTSTRCRSASSTPSAPTCGSRTSSVAACRTTAAGADRARRRSANGILNSDWFRVGGGDGFYTANDQSDWTILYSESQDGATSRVDLRAGRSNSIRPRGPGQGRGRRADRRDA